MSQYLNVEDLRTQFKPTAIKLIIVGESRPNDPSRFFYNYEVQEHDSLYLETMKSIHLKTTDVQGSLTEKFRADKQAYLKDFQRSGFYLMDVVPEKIEKKPDRKKKVRLFATSFIDRLEKLKGLDKNKTRILLMSRHVFDNLLEPLVRHGFNVSKEMLPFGGNGQQPKFRHILREELGKLP